jgi:hypothetical protein
LPIGIVRIGVSGTGRGDWKARFGALGVVSAGVPTVEEVLDIGLVGSSVS